MILAQIFISHYLFLSLFGIFIEIANNNTLTNNTVIENGDYGIFMETSNYNTLTNNTINDNLDYGIYLDDAHDNTITWNVLHGNVGCIFEVAGCTGNNIANNDCGSGGPGNGGPPPPIPGFSWIFALLGLVFVIALVFTLRQKQGRLRLGS